MSQLHSDLVQEGTEPESSQLSSLLQDQQGTVPKSSQLLSYDRKTISVHHHMFYSCCMWWCKTRMVQYQPVGSCCFCSSKTVDLWAVNAFRIWTQLHSLFLYHFTSSKSKNRNLYSWVRYCKTISVHHHIDLQLLHLVLQNTHVTVPTRWHLLFLLE
jgi:hypothetical protein